MGPLLGPFGAHLGRLWGELGAILGPFGTPLGHIGPTLGVNFVRLRRLLTIGDDDDDDDDNDDDIDHNAVDHDDGDDAERKYDDDHDGDDGDAADCDHYAVCGDVVFITRVMRDEKRKNMTNMEL